MFKPIRILLGLVGLFAIILIVAVIGIFWYVDVLAKRGVEAGGTYALGVDTTVRSVNIGLLRGTVTLDGLNIANPEGFGAPTFLAMEDGQTTVEVGSLLGGEVIRIPRLHLTDLDVHLVRSPEGKSNYRVILDHLEQLGQGSKPKSPPDGGERRLIISELVLRNVTVHAAVATPQQVGQLLGRDGTLGSSVTIPEIRLTDVGKTGEGVAGTGITMAELVGLVVEAILTAAVQLGGDVFPAELFDDLRGRVAQLANIEKLTGSIQQLGKELGDELGRVGAPEELGDVLERGRDGLRDILPGKRREEPPPPK